MVELRKRKDPPQPAPPPPARKRSSNPVKSDIEKDKAAATDETKPSASSKNASTGGFPTVGSSIDLEGFGGEIENNDGEKTNLKQLAEDSTGGVVLFTYPKASTPGCKSFNGSPSNTLY